MTDHAHAIYFGEVTDVFAHWFVVGTESGKILADLGPDGPRPMTLRPGDKVTFSGEAKPFEIKVRESSRNDEPTIAIEQKKPPKTDRSEGDPNRAIETTAATGFAVVGSPRCKPKHFEWLGSRHAERCLTTDVDRARVRKSLSAKKVRGKPVDERSQSGAGPGAIWPLQSLNFFMADMQAGVGPFLGVFLLAHGWEAGPIGTVMTIGGVAGMLMTAPAGALVDGTKRKRLYVVIPGICTVLASVIILISQHFWVVAASQVATAIAGAAIGPAVNGITLGIVRQGGFVRQNGHNQAFNHAGNMVGAGLSGWLGWAFGMPAVFGLAALFGVLSIASVMLIPRGAIDDNVARGLKAGDASAKASGFKVLAECKPLLILAASLACFHLGNAAMLPLYGMAVVSAKQGNPSGFVAMTIVVAQAVMIVASLVAMRVIEKRGAWIVMLISFLVLPLRGALAAGLIDAWGVYPVQTLDGVGAGLQSVAVPALVARVLNGTGRVNVGQGAVMTCQGLGASLSPAIGGWMAQDLGYPATFLILGGFALGSIALWTAFASVLKPACSGEARAAGEIPAPGAPA